MSPPQARRGGARQRNLSRYDILPGPARNRLVLFLPRPARARGLMRNEMK